VKRSLPNPDKEAWPRSVEVIGLITVLGVTLAVFAGAFEGFFVQDDFGWLESTRIAGAGDLLKSFFRFNPAASYRPLSQETVFFVGQRVFGMWPPGFHLLSLVFHLLATLLTYLLLREFFPPLPSLAATFFFAVHSAHQWAIYWISAIAEPMALVFFLASLILFIRFDRAGSRFAYAGSVTAMVFGIMCKESILPLPLVLLSYCVIFSRHRLGWTLPHITLTGLYFFFRATSSTIQVSPYPLTSGPEVGQNLAAYLSWTAGFSETLLKRILGWSPEGSYPFVAGVLFLVLAVLFLLSRRRDTALFALLWFIFALQPVLYFSQHIYPYYLAPALPAIALLLASVIPSQRGIFEWTTLVPSLALGFYIASISIPSIMLEGSWWVDRSLKGRAILDQMSRVAQSVPEGSKAYIFGFAADELGILQDDAAFKALGLSPAKYIIVGLHPQTLEQINHLKRTNELQAYHCYLYELGTLVDKTELFRTDPGLLFPVYRDRPEIKLEVLPAEVYAGEGSLKLELINLDVPAIDVMYTIDGRSMPPVINWRLDETHRAILFLDKSTPKGLYHLIGIRDSRQGGQNVWIRTDVKVRVH